MHPTPPTLEQTGDVQRRAPSVPGRMLRDFDELTASRHVDRLQGDQALLERLMWSSFTGPEYERFKEVLAGYGFAVLSSWCRTSAIFGHCRTKGFGNLTACGLGVDAAQELAAETVAVALRHFREHVLVPHRWDAERGASLKTFFIGQCLLQFPNVYRHWYRYDRPTAATDDGIHMLEAVRTEMTRAQHPLVEHQVLERLTVRAELDRLDPQTQRVVLLKAIGASNADIAQELGLSISDIKTRWHRITNSPNRKGHGDAA